MSQAQKAGIIIDSEYYIKRYYGWKIEDIYIKNVCIYWIIDVKIYVYLPRGKDRHRGAWLTDYLNKIF